MSRLEGKVAIISGAASGMGAEEARLFASEGTKVVLTDVTEDDGRRVEAEIHEAGGEAVFVKADVTVEKDWEMVVATALSRFGRLNVLVNNTGISSGSFADPTDTDGWRKIMDINATGVFLGTKHAIPEMKKAGGGSIVNISSIMGFVGGGSGHPAYHASKGAVRIFTKATAVRYGPDGIRANSVHPGPIATPMNESTQADERHYRTTLSRIPLGRYGESEEVAYGVLFLASDESAFMTGSELVIDGGLTAQ